jgi:S1/P1 Nuclease
MQITIRAAFLTAFAAIAIPAPAVAWDYAGHRIVGAVADIILQRDHPDVYARVLKLLERKPANPASATRVLSEVAVFPDCAKDEKEFCGRRPTMEEIEYVLRNNVHRTFHFTNSPFQQKKYLAAGVGTMESDIVQMINHTVEQLQGKRPYFKNNVKLENEEALWLLAHLVGDIHQPLHVGQPYYDKTCEKIIDPNASKDVEAVSTLGGNAIKLPGGEVPSLHIYWDAIAVAKAMQKEGFSGDEPAFARALATTPPASWQSVGIPETWAEQWIEETMPLTEAAYQLKIEHDPAQDRIPGFPSATISCGLKTTITPQYEAWAAGMAHAQLHKAGYRLAAILVAVLKP